jgi:hypothetical protein
MLPNGTDRPPAHGVIDCTGCGRTFDRQRVDAEGSCPICRVTHLRAEQNAADLALATVAQVIGESLTYASPEDILAAAGRVIDARDALRAPTRDEVDALLARAEADVDALLAGADHGTVA